MSYDKQSIVPVMDAKTWFDKVAKEYHQYRKLLSSVDSNRFLRFLPRSLRDLTILDLGAGDGRIFEHFKNTQYKEYIALDISQGMLDRFQSSSITKICADAEERIPLSDESVDVVCVFFVIEYIADLQQFFLEISRVLKSGWVCVASYFHQRNSFVFGHGENRLKVERFPHSYDVVEEAVEYSFLSIDKMPIISADKQVWYIYEFKKH